MSEYVHENDNYYVAVGESEHDENNIECYKIVNKKTGVTEAETTVLYRAIGIANECDEELTKLSPIVQAPVMPHLNS